MQDNIDVFFTLIAGKLNQLRMDDSDADWQAMREALDASELDASIQAKLAGLVQTTAAPQADWDLLENELDELAVDAAIRDQLESVAVPLDTEAWSQLEPELDELDFDQALRSKLETADMPGEEAGWALLASQLGEEFDRVMAQKLSDAEISGESEWPIMEDQLEAPTEAALAEKISNYSFPYTKKAWKEFLPILNRAMPVKGFPWKTVAAVAILLLMLGTVGIYISKGNLFKSHQESTFGPAQEQSMSQAPKEAFDSDGNLSEHIHAAPEESSAKETIQQPTAQQTNKAQPGKAETGVHSTLESNRELSEGTQTENSEELPDIISGIGPNTISQPNSHSEKAHSAKRYVKEVESFKVNISAPSLGTQPKLIAADFARKKASKKLFDGNIRIGWTHAVFNSSTRLSDPGKPGYLSGLQLNVPLTDRLQLITGVLYGQKPVSREMLNIYTPPPVSANIRAGDPVIWTSLLEADHTVIEIPIMLRYRLTPEGKHLSLALQGGLSGLMVQKVQYRHFDPESPLNSNAGAVADLRSLKAEEEYQMGGAYWGNFRVAPVIEYRIGGHLLLELAPYLQFGQQRVGSKQLKLHSAGGTASVLIEIGKKSAN